MLRLEGPAGSLEWPSGLGERVLSQATAHHIKSMLRSVVVSGTGKAAALPHHSAAGKTGTAQKVVNGRYSMDHYVASFMGFAPVQHPRLVVVVVLDEPRSAHTGGVVAAPVFREVTTFALEQLRLAEGGAI